MIVIIGGGGSKPKTWQQQERENSPLSKTRDSNGTARHGASNAKTLFYVEQLKGGVDDEEEEREASSSSRIKHSRSSVRVLSLCTEE